MWSMLRFECRSGWRWLGWSILRRARCAPSMRGIISWRGSMISDHERDELGLVRLPRDAEVLLERVSAPDRLSAHLTLVHDVASRLLDALTAAFPGLELPRDEILFGAAIHDIGKAVVRSELSSPGHEHE